MKSVCAWVLFVGAASLASARPVVLEETATLANPDPAAYPSFGGQVATNGEYAVLLGSRDEYVDGELLMHRAALLYRRVAGQWQFQQVLRSTVRGYDSYFYPSLFAMKGDLAVIELDGASHAYRLGLSGWQSVATISGPNEDLEIDGQRIVVGAGECRWNAYAFDPDGAGGWTGTFLQGQPRGNDDEFWGGPVDIAGDRVIIGTPYTYDLEVQEIPIYERSGSSWIRALSIVTPGHNREFTGEVALRGDDAIIDSFYGAYVYRLARPFEPASRLQPPDAYQRSVFSSRIAHIEKSGDLVLVREPSFDRGANVINVYRAIAASPGHYEHVAVLTPSAGGSISNSFEVSGNTVIAGGNQVAYLFELPASLTPPAPRQDNFESGNAASWSTIAGSQFSVVASGSTISIVRAATRAMRARCSAIRTGPARRSKRKSLQPRSTAAIGGWAWSRATRIRRTTST